MPLIVDANRASDFSRPVPQQAAAILEAIKGRKIRIAVGGTLLEEIVRTPMRNLIAEMDRQGLLIRVNGERVSIEQNIICGLRTKSNDIHVIAVARISNSRLIYTDDADLIKDFKNIDIISPKGKVIKSTTKANIAKSLIRIYGT